MLIDSHSASILAITLSQTEQIIFKPARDIDATAHLMPLDIDS